MANVKSLDRATTKWERQSSVSQPEYEAGVNAPRSDWAKATAAAEDNYNRGVQAAIQRKAFGKGVTKAGTDRWKQGALEKGSNRWAEGIRLSGNRYAEGFAPYRAVIEKTSLPPRGPKGDPANIQRVSVISKALHDEKVRRQGA